MSMIRDIQDWLFWRRELKTRRQIQRAAFADGRFVLNLHMRGETALVSFTPREEEAPRFFRNYVAPVCLSYSGAFNHTSWDGPGSDSQRAESHWVRVRRFSDIARIEILAPDEAYRDRLATVLDHVVDGIAGEAEAKWRGSVKETASDPIL